MANTKITNHIVDKTFITGQTAVTAADGDYLLVSDASDSGALKKVLASDLIQTSEEVQDLIGAMFSSNTETGIAATYQDADGTIDLVVGTLNQDTTGTAATVTGAAQSAITSLGTLTALTVDDITIDGSTISDAGNFTLDVEGDINFDANGSDITLLDGGTEFGRFKQVSNGMRIQTTASDADMTFMGNDGGSEFTALTLDMSAAGGATFNEGIKLSGLNGGSGLAFDMAGSGDYTIKESSTDDVMSFQGHLFHNFSNGRIGIGTADPDAMLEIVSSDPRLRLRDDTAGGGADNGGHIEFVGHHAGSSDGKREFARIKGLKENGTGGDTKGYLSFLTNDGSLSEAARFNSAGNLLIGTPSDVGVAGGGLRLTFPSNESDGDLFFVSNGGGSNATPVLMYVVQGEGFSSNHGAMAVGRHTGNNRSINAGGTINASGNDYAEYMLKSSGCGTIAKGDVVGVDADGKLTKTFSAAKSFVIKSTDPSYVGGDTWWTEKEPEPKYTDDTKSTKTDDFKDWETRMETARGTVDRIAFSGQVPVNITGSFNVGDYVYPQVNSSGIKAVAKASPTFEEYQLCVGKIWTTMDDGRPLVAVKIG